VDEHRFDGRVAVVTGAGRGIGRAYARLLAELGARVVVNDLGGSMGGNGADAQPASRFADEIVGAGGVAIADTSDVAMAAGAATLVGAAVEKFGRLDVLINNAGIMRWAGMPEVDEDDLARHLAVHVLGSFNTTRAAWPHMVEQGYGRIVMTTSAGVFGLPKNTSYATAKGAVIGLTRSLKTRGAAYGIKVNLIAPAAWTRMAGRPSDGDKGDADDPADVDDSHGGDLATQMSPDLVAPMVAFLAHEACPVSGEIYAAGAGRFARIFVASTEGYLHPTPDVAVADIARNWATINDETGYYVPADLNAWSAAFMNHLQLQDEAPTDQ
jgi:NAD(P)-dependent dehydrogenase (short-subunit alcohol dehydrogenase family)